MKSAYDDLLFTAFPKFIDNAFVNLK